MERWIDISHYQGTYYGQNPPNLAGAVIDNVVGVITKVTDSYISTWTDSMFSYIWNETKNKGLKRGGYHFWRANDTNNIIDLFCKSMDNGMDYPPVLDFEPSLQTYTTRIPGVDIKVKAILDRIELNTGIKPIIYTGRPYWNLHFPVAPSWLFQYKLWLAAYPLVITPSKNQWDLSRYGYQTPSLPIGWTYDQLDTWQFYDKGTEFGFAGSSVDLNYRYPNGFTKG